MSATKVLKYHKYTKKQKKNLDFSLRSLNTSKVKTMSCLFKNCENLTQLDLSTFNTEQVVNMSNMFQNCKGKTQTLDLSNFSLNSVKHMEYMFNNCSSIKIIKLGIVTLTNNVSVEGLFEGCTKLEKIEGWDNHNNWSHFTNTDKLFKNCKNLTSLPTNNLDTYNVTSMKSMFENCTKLTFGDSGELTIMSGRATNMDNMFKGCTSLEKLDLSKQESYRSLTSANDMFSDCTKLKTLIVHQLFMANKIDRNAGSKAFNNVTGLKVLIKPSVSFSTGEFENEKKSFQDQFGFVIGTNGTIEQYVK